MGEPLEFAWGPDRQIELLNATGVDAARKLRGCAGRKVRGVVVGG
jgi:hypothetical protein